MIGEVTAQTGDSSLVGRQHSQLQSFRIEVLSAARRRLNGSESSAGNFLCASSVLFTKVPLTSLRFVHLIFSLLLSSFSSFYFWIS